MKKLSFDENELRSMVDNDVQKWKIAEHFGCSKSCVERRMKNLGLKSKRTGPKSGERHPDWQGGTTIRKGYRYLWRPDHPHCINGRYVAEHRLVMEQKLGRLLDRKEVVHHKDGDRLNNDINNLELFQTNAEHLYEHLADNEEHAQAIREAMADPEVRKQIREGLLRYHREKKIRQMSE